MHNKFMRLGLGSAFAWNSSLWCADQAQRAGMCQSEESGAGPHCPGTGGNMLSPSWMLLKTLQQWLLWGSYNHHQLWVGLSSKQLLFGEKDKVVLAVDCLLSGSKLNWKRKKRGCFFSWVSEPSHRSARQKTGGQVVAGRLWAEVREDSETKRKGKSLWCDPWC